MEEFDNKGGKHCMYTLHVMYMQRVLKVNRNLLMQLFFCGLYVAFCQKAS